MRLAGSAAGVLAVARARGECDNTVLTEVFDEAEPVGIGFLTGTWRGAAFENASEAALRMADLNWYGKRFTDAETVEPLLCRDAAGTVVAYTALGQARLREVSFRGKVSAAMVYDDLPVIDHFRKLDENTVLGLMDPKGRPVDFFFHLTRVTYA